MNIEDIPVDGINVCRLAACLEKIPDDEINTTAAESSGAFTVCVVSCASNLQNLKKTHPTHQQGLVAVKKNALSCKHTEVRSAGCLCEPWGFSGGSEKQATE